jgi:hypothetical protein
MPRAAVDAEASKATAADRVAPAATFLARAVAARALLVAEAVPKPALLRLQCRWAFRLERYRKPLQAWIIKESWASVAAMMTK